MDGGRSASLAGRVNSIPRQHCHVLQICKRKHKLGDKIGNRVTH